MMNGQIKLGNDIQIAIENQFVLHAQVYSNQTYTRVLLPFLHFLSEFVQLSTYILSDSGYGSQENL